MSSLAEGAGAMAQHYGLDVEETTAGTLQAELEMLTCALTTVAGDAVIGVGAGARVTARVTKRPEARVRSRQIPYIP
jgi:hypothetical protein